MNGRRCTVGRALPALLLAMALAAQEELRWEGPAPATLRLGDTAQIALLVEGAAANPRAPELPAVDGLLLQVSGPSRESYQSFDGRRMTSRVTTRYTILVRPQREGAFTIPPIRIHTGSKTQETGAMRLDVVRDLRGEEFGYLNVAVEPLRVYVHEPVWVRVEFGAEAGLRPVTDVHQRYRYVDFEVQAPWLNKMEGAVDLALPEPENGTLVVLNRSLQRADYSPSQERDGKRWHAFTFDKAFLPTRPGVMELPAPLLRYNVLLRDGRVGLFGERVNSQTQNYYVYGKPVRLEVLPIPEAGRPTPYFGAVGRFTVDASLDRDTVQVGDSLKLTFTVSGRGNLEFQRWPDLTDLEGFHKRGQTEHREQERVVVTYDLTPLDTRVTAVPPIQWNYFDTTPGVERFVEVATPALPVTVQPLANGETLLPIPGAAETRAVVPGVDDIFDIRPLDGPALTAPRHPPSWLGWLLVLGPWCLALGLAFLRAAQRRRAADPLGQRARMAARTCARSLASGVAPVDALTSYLGDRLGVPAAAAIGPDLQQRLVAAGLDADLAAEAAGAVERGVAARYGGASGLDACTVGSLVERMEGSDLRRPAGTASLVLLTVLLGGAAMAQEPVAAYRQGDYPAAVAGFRAVAERTDDARAWFDLGNAHYRQDDLPRAIWAWERARAGLPRDPELRQNLALARKRLELGDGGGEAFLEAVAALRATFTAGELLAMAALLQGAAALLLLLGWRRAWLRGLGFAALVPGLLLALEVLWFAPARPLRGIALDRVPIVAEPRADLAPVATVRAGASVAVLGGSDNWLRVAAGGRTGYARAADIALLR